MNKLSIVSLAVSALLLFTAPGWALWGMPTSLEGTIQSIENNIIQLAQESEPGSALEVVSVEVNDSTAFDQVASLDELNVGDKIEVKYKEEQGKKIATEISLVEGEASDAAVPETETPGATTPNKGVPETPAPRY